MKDKEQLTQTAVVVAVLIFTHLFALFLGSTLQRRAQRINSHAQRSDVSSAIELGEYFSVVEVSEERFLPARATAGIVFRILESSSHGPHSKARLEALRAELRSRYLEPALTPEEAAKRKASLAARQPGFR